jgi:hypothetical protein
MAAGGSRERLEVWQFYGPLYPPHGIEAMGKTSRWVIPGSRLLLTHRAAMLQSGSPPGRWERIQSSVGKRRRQKTFSTTRTRTIGRDRPSRRSNQYAGDKDQDAAEDDLKDCREQRGIHEVISDPRDDAELNGDNDYGDNHGQQEVRD